MDLVDGGVDVLLGVRLHMTGDEVAAGIAELLHIAHGAVDHQVDVQRQDSGGANGLHHGNADGDVGHEQTVHHVHVDVIGGGDGLNIAAQMGKIGGEDRRSDFYHTETPFGGTGRAGAA